MNPSPVLGSEAPSLRVGGFALPRNSPAAPHFTLGTCLGHEKAPTLVVESGGLAHQQSQS
jgi:hypothetical protein